MTRTLIQSITLATCLLTMTACSNQPATTLPASTDTSAATSNTIQLTKEDLIGRYFVLNAVNGKPVTFSPTQPELMFGKNMILAGGMCNRFHGSATLDGNVLKAPELASTMMLCEPALNDLEQQFFQMMRDGVTLETVDGNLVISDAKKDTVLTFKPSTPPEQPADNSEEK